MSKIHHGGNIEEVAEKLNVPVEEIKDFSANINPLGFPSDLWNVLVQSFANIEVYPNPKYPELKKAIAGQLDVDADDVFVGNGATEILDEAIRAEKATDALILAPTFGEYERLFKRTGVKVHHYQLQEKNDFTLKMDNLLDLLRAHHEITVICLTSPNNPTGQVISPKDLRMLTDFCNKHHRLLILDESFIDLTVGSQPSFVNELTDQDRVYIVRAATKFFAIPGLRLGYGITKNNKLKALMKVQENTWSVNGIADVFGQNMFRAKRYIELTHQWLDVQQPALYEALRKIKTIKVFPSVTNFFLFKCSDPDLREKLIRQRILIRQCDDYEGLGAQYYRVAVKGPQDNVMLVNTLKKVLGRGER
ncbi:aminotransferase class I/II-fold pyridoxal phosphate-dependent enzyme [Limosilactobacillus sp. RRLNB_1_1]|uniref:Aminotransferase class I/II-fold pyridoxal phosphate-dependent enzyme n=1 Tax=Limosilactobacillus albertensis TaxID=2759752 RepID=A0A7W3TRE8_9LACO|nr:threonine-phosphate decarboxylase [Limosilactobacillus albertensis]MBB1069518.1 aminotransferase class I/II-fold pyridoxal phosphate-dependent enzyme [Limosilactobacillus albertensis]MCD7118044.1 aminotransferase class I/II-fold pyridoxal phosphate-dependent enzyme [Limosilactobacillus albertensis]MCD7127702.1 aminotransferase class I/II-fold pyridoxal phosphate-dependent enzyme [Limosilactobacillus albertensis]